MKPSEIKESLHRKACRSGKKYKHGASRTPEHQAWRAMIHRCTNQNNTNYKRYGGRGISICKRWLGEHGFINFITDMGPRPADKTLDRFPDSNGNYTPKNTRWANRKEQSRNREYVKLSLKLAAEIKLRRSREQLKYKELAKEYGVSIVAIDRVLNGRSWV
jgi:hypothetical protein